MEGRQSRLESKQSGKQREAKLSGNFDTNDHKALVDCECKSDILG